jgi:hypothetical protein
MKKIIVKKTNSIQKAREESFEPVMNDATKAAQRNYNVTMRDKYQPGDEVDVSKRHKR